MGITKSDESWLAILFSASIFYHNFPKNALGVFSIFNSKKIPLNRRVFDGYMSAQDR
jgi:hypothetical protein